MAMVKKSKPWWAAVAFLFLAALCVTASCTEILGIDTQYDENPCADGAEPPVACGEGACRVFKDGCDASGLPAVCSPGKANDVDTCGDGLDNDCDGSVDENDSGSCTCDALAGDTKACFPGAPSNRNKGVCRDGTQKCQTSTWGPCEDAILPSEDIADGLDNDCDGTIDEDVECEDDTQQYCFGGAEGQINVGPCAQGTQTCKDGHWAECIGQTLPSIEICDGFDNDCDDDVDDTGDPNSVCECNVVTDKPQPCYVNAAGDVIGCPDNLKGACECGELPCVNGKWSTVCEGVVTPTEKDVCDGQVDDDCDGVVDNINPMGPCVCLTGTQEECYTGMPQGSAGVGTCVKGTHTCVNGQWSTCQGEKTPTQEICDSLDNDCNGLDDDGVPGVGEVCYLAQFADTPCYTGTIKCELGDSTPKCVPNVQPGTVLEDCDGVDDNCDGIKDNGLFCCKGDGKESGNETDIDCGGGCDTKCEDGQGCKIGIDCESGNCVNDTCVSPTCGDGVKNGGESDEDCGLVCVNKCLVGQSCNVNTDCTSNLCEPANKKCIQKVPGETCLAAVECSSGYCVDGVCCNAACNGVCQACSTQKKGGGLNGACEPVADNTDPDSDCDTDVESSCQLTGVCKAGACAKFPAGAVCQAASCTGPSTLNQADVCDGNGACVAVLEQDCGAYACVGNQCKITCVNDGECAADYFCESQQCKAKKPLGQVCAGAAQCASNYCADGVCCNNDCGGTCKACNQGGSVGICQNIAVNQDPANECAASQCDGLGLCQKQNGQSCSVSGQCVSGNCVDGVCCNTGCFGTCLACDIAGSVGTCVNVPANEDPASECPNGACSGSGDCQGVAATPCTVPAMCATGFCVDGYCCDAACTGTCQGCSGLVKGSGANGVCGSVTAGSDPGNECNPGACAGNGTCQGTNGNPCAQGSQCVSGFCIDGVCCNTDCSGTCQACNLANSVGTCSSVLGGQDPSNECNPGACDGAGTCQKSNGQTCSSNGQCVSGFCADGVCCNTACSGTCLACSAAVKGQGADGACEPISAGTDPQNDCAQQPVSTCGNTGYCNGAGACEQYTNGTVCVAAECIDPSTLSKQDACMAGLCQNGGTQDCTPYACNGSACNVSCTTSSQCAPGSYCEAPLCKAKKPISSMCLSAGECQSGFCADGVCCGTACTGECKTCALMGSLGTCVNVPSGAIDAPNCQGVQVCNGAGTCVDNDGQPCATSGECFSSSCVDTVCCNNACSGLCNACTGAKKGSGMDGQCGPIGNGLDPDSECAGSSTCNGASACSLLPPGSPCNVAAECGSGICVDNVCCTTACSGTCQACSAAKTNGVNGTCASIPSNSDPDNECTTECNGSGVCEVAIGSSCMGNADCQSGNCADGVCCNNACNGVCQSCNLAGQVGTCANIASGQDPANECADAEVCSGTGTCVKPLGAACNGASDCLSGFCADGVCCNSLCSGTCQACSLAGSVGACVNVPSGQVDSPNCGGGQVCNGSGTCVDTNGQPCATGSECLSTICVDAVCCNTACSGACNACSATKKGTGADGVCGVIDSGQDPDNECVGLTSCNGAGACALLIVGSTCSQNAECGSGFCVDNVCCGTACLGACVACSALKTNGTNGMCSPIPADSDPDSECAGTQVCNGAGTCKKANGDGCGMAGECLSNQCVDGVCCNSACSSTCQACSAAKTGGTNGTCSNVTASTDPDSECVGVTSCNGSGACTQLAQGTACSINAECASGACVDGFCCDTACGGLCEACSNAKTGQANGACNSVSSSTDPDNECAGALSCKAAGVCFKADGVSCGGNGDCQSGNCVDGVCCNTACGGTCEACDVAGSIGTCFAFAANTDPDMECNGNSGADVCNGMGVGLSACKAVNGSTCSAAGECLSGQCADGVCCNTACTTTCQACNVAGSEGTCTDIPTGQDDTSATVTCSGANVSCDEGACKGEVGQTCNAALMGDDCLSGQCFDGVCCNAACGGTCEACDVMGSIGTCFAFAANTDPDLECNGNGGDDVCNGMGIGMSACKEINGATCSAATECLSGHCVDDVCCDDACTSPCEACNVANWEGTCTDIPTGMDPDSECSGTTTCNGSGVCTVLANGVTCGTNIECESNMCGGAKCLANFGEDCNNNADCGSSDCVGSGQKTCAKGAFGAQCGSGVDCTSNNCVSGFCN